jgi:hypothetical protein
MSNIEVIRGDDVSLKLTFTDINGNAIDLTDTTVFFTVKKKLSDTDDEALISKTIDTFDDPTTGIMTILISDTETDLKSGSYYYDVQLKDENGYISSISKQRFSVEQDITLRIS